MEREEEPPAAATWGAGTGALDRSPGEEPPLRLLAPLRLSSSSVPLLPLLLGLEFSPARGLRLRPLALTEVLVS